MAMAKRSSSGKTVLRPTTSSVGKRSIRSVDQLLTTKQRSDLRDDLSEMARQRRDAETSSSSLRLS
jgi:hypothetical protein